MALEPINGVLVLMENLPMLDHVSPAKKKVFKLKKILNATTTTGTTVLKFKVGQKVIGVDAYDIVNNSIGTIISIHQSYLAEDIYLVKFDRGKFIMKEYQLRKL